MADDAEREISPSVSDLLTRVKRAHVEVLTALKSGPPYSDHTRSLAVRYYLLRGVAAEAVTMLEQPRDMIDVLIWRLALEGMGMED